MSGDRVHTLLAALEAAASTEDEQASHVVVVVDDDLGPGPAAGPFVGALQALLAAERLEAALNDESVGPPVKTRVVRLFTPPTR